MDITTLTATTTALLTTVANTLITAVFAFIQFILPYSVAVALLMVGLAIVWRIFRSVGHV